MTASVTIFVDIFATSQSRWTPFDAKTNKLITIRLTDNKHCLHCRKAHYANFKWKIYMNSWCQAALVTSQSDHSDAINDHITGIYVSHQTPSRCTSWSLKCLLSLNLLSCSRCRTTSCRRLQNTTCWGSTFSLFVDQAHSLTLVMLPMQKLLVVNKSRTLGVHQFLAEMFTLQKLQHHQTLWIL